MWGKGKYVKNGNWVIKYISMKDKFYYKINILWGWVNIDYFCWRVWESNEGF